MSDALTGRLFINTRPLHQAAPLSQALRLAGATVVDFPSLEIEPLDELSALDTALQTTWDSVICISANAALIAVERRRALGHKGLQGMACAATGPGSARVLREAGATQVIAPPERFDSEGLLAELDRQGIVLRRVLIIKGEGGRDLLTSSLRARGIEVTELACYRRVCSRADPSAFGKAAHSGCYSGCVITSSEGAQCLMQVLGANAAALINRAPVFVPHPRIAERLRELGAAQIVETAGGDDGLLAGILAHHLARLVAPSGV